MKNVAWLLLCSLILGTPSLKAEVIDFEELNPTFTTNGGLYFNGRNVAGTSNNDGWTSGGAYFQNNYISTGASGYWGGWSYSNVVNKTAGTFLNQYASFAGGGSNGSGGVVAGGNYAITFTGSGTTSGGTPVEASYLNLPTLSQLVSIDISNATYAALYARDGAGSFGPPELSKFGDGDFFRVVISGYDGLAGTGNLTGQFTYDLINYGGAGTADDYILADWLKVDLAGFGLTQSLTFATTSSQITNYGEGSYGSDVPGYVAIDNIVTAVPEPGSMIAIAVASVSGYYVRRRRRNNSAA